MTTSDLTTFNVAGEGDYLTSEETALPLILINLQDSFNFLIEQVNPLKPTL